jgi:hypothetical protein
MHLFLLAQAHNGDKGPIRSLEIHSGRKGATNYVPLGLAHRKIHRFCCASERGVNVRGIY